MIVGLSGEGADLLLTLRGLSANLGSLPKMHCVALVNAREFFQGEARSVTVSVWMLAIPDAGEVYFLSDFVLYAFDPATFSILLFRIYNLLHCRKST